MEKGLDPCNPHLPACETSWQEWVEDCGGQEPLVSARDKGEEGGRAGNTTRRGSGGAHSMSSQLHFDLGIAVISALHRAAPLPSTTPAHALPMIIISKSTNSTRSGVRTCHR